MIRIVHVIEKSSGYLIAEYLIEIKKHNEFEIDFFDEAWLHAVYDGLVKSTNRTMYTLVFVKDFLVN